MPSRFRPFDRLASAQERSGHDVVGFGLACCVKQGPASKDIGVVSNLVGVDCLLATGSLLSLQKADDADWQSRKPFLTGQLV